MPINSCQIHLYRVRDTRSIGIVTGDIRRVRCAEVWVNSENTAMQMARVDEFSVSSIIRYEGARRDATGQVVDDLIADKLAQTMRGRPRVPAGTAILTGSGQLHRFGVRYVVHVAAVHGEPGAGFRQVSEIGRCVTNVLTVIDQLAVEPPVRTVMFPLLGTGQGGGELRPTVAALIGAAIDYLMVSETRLTTVYFLAYTDLELVVCEATCAVCGLVRSGGPRARRSDRNLRLGIVVDVVGFGRRPAPDQDAVQQRLSALAHTVLREAGWELGSVDHQWTGDGFAVFFPSHIDPARVLADLISAVLRRLARDNHTNRDRVRLRMAAGIGLIAPGSAGFAGSMIVDINRLLDSAALRQALADNPGADLAVLLSDHLHAAVIRPGYLRLPGPEPRRVDVAVKEFHEPAWLWVAPEPGR